MNSLVTGYIRHFKRTFSADFINHVVLRNRSAVRLPKTYRCLTTDATLSRHWPARVTGTSEACFQSRRIHDGQQNYVKAVADDNVDASSSRAHTPNRRPSQGRLGRPFRASPVAGGNEGSDDLGDWCESADIPDEVLGDFRRYRISESAVKRLKAKGIPFLFPVQTSTFNPIYDGPDVIVQARTGSGKTLSYVLPLLEVLQQKARTTPGRAPQLLVMTPTRELARQVSDVIESLSESLSVACVYGGAPMGPQQSCIQSGVDVVVGTPGRIQDMITRRILNLKSLDHVVLDEVDRMLDMGFADSVDAILKERYVSGNVKGNPQTLLFSATVPSWVQQTARKYLRPGLKKLDLVGTGTPRTATTVEHFAVQCRYFDRTSVIADLLQVYSGDHGRAIVFCETKREADQLATSGAIRQETHVLHGDIPQNKRELVLKGFRDARYKCLIATDVAARGIDIPEVDLVIQCSPSKDIDSYIHRSGRTGRAGRKGVSILLYKSEEFQDLQTLERTAGFKFQKMSAPESEEISAAKEKDVTKSLNLVTPEAAADFNEAAEELIAEKGAVPALSAALAFISGATKERRATSVHTSRPNRSHFKPAGFDRRTGGNRDVDEDGYHERSYRRNTLSSSRNHSFSSRGGDSDFKPFSYRKNNKFGGLEDDDDF